MSESIILALPIVVLFFMAISYYLLSTATVELTPPVSFSVNNSTYSFTAYALNETEAEQGLMNASVTNKTFMLFVFNSSAIYSFWMKNTYSPLDIIWIDAKNSTGRIVYIVNATPCVSYSYNQTGCIIYTPKAPSNYVIEARSGFAERNNLQIGQTIFFNYG